MMVVASGETILDPISNEPKAGAALIRCELEREGLVWFTSPHTTLHVTHVHIEDEYYLDLDSNPSFT
jgi:hypothetical protein